MKKIALTVPKSLLRQFRRQALEAFPVETCSFLIGTERQTRAKRYVEVKELWTPDEIWDEKNKKAVKNERCTPDHIIFSDDWFLRAEEHAREAGLELTGCIHVHPYRYDELRKPDCSDSEADQDYFSKWPHVSGILLINESKTGRKYTRFKFWGPREPVELIT